MATNDSYRSGEDVRFDANGNKVYDSSMGDHSRTGYADGDRGGYPGNRSGSDWNARNARDGNTSSWRDSQSNRADINRSSWGDRTWNDTDVVMVNESELPSGARSCLSREAGGTALSEAGRGMWDGKQAYCARVMKNGHAYKVISDADGNLIAMRRLD